MKELALLLVFLLPGTKSQTLQKRLIGGSDCQPNERHYHVQIDIEDSLLYASCGGSLISSRWVLTSAHCYEPHWAATLKVTVGVHPSTSNKKRTFEIKTQNIFHYSENFEDNDILLIKLPEAVTNINTVDLPQMGCRQPSNGALLQVAGAGANTVTKDGKEGQSPKSLQCLSTQVTTCPANYADPENLANEHYFCAGTMKGKPVADSCHGDSGGGFVVRDIQNLPDQIFGVLIGGLEELCQAPIAIVDVCWYRQWIEDIMKKNRE